jgi:hypothetical protein
VENVYAQFLIKSQNFCFMKNMLLITLILFSVNIIAQDTTFYDRNYKIVPSINQCYFYGIIKRNEIDTNKAISEIFYKSIKDALEKYSADLAAAKGLGLQLVAEKNKSRQRETREKIDQLCRCILSNRKWSVAPTSPAIIGIGRKYQEEFIGSVNFFSLATIQVTAFKN